MLGRSFLFLALMLVAAGLAACDTSTGAELASAPRGLSDEDDLCQPDGLLVADQPGLAGQKLCLAGETTVNLLDRPYLDCQGTPSPPGTCTPSNWAGRVKSFRSTDVHGAFVRFSGGARLDTPFASNVQVDVAAPEIQATSMIVLHPDRCIPRRCPVARTCGIVDDGCGGQLCCTNGCPGQTCQPE